MSVRFVDVIDAVGTLSPVVIPDTMSYVPVAPCAPCATMASETGLAARQAERGTCARPTLARVMSITH